MFVVEVNEITLHQPDDSSSSAMKYTNHAQVRLLSPTLILVRHIAKRQSTKFSLLLKLDLVL